MADFDWKHDHDPSIVLSWQPRVAVYASRAGVVVRQEADPFDDDRGDDMVLLTPMGALQVAWKMIEAAHEIGIQAPPRKLMTKPLDLGPPSAPMPLIHPEPVDAEAGPLLKAMERGTPVNDRKRLATAANPSGRQSPKVAAE